MFRKVLILAAIILVFWACEVQAAVIYSTWDGGGDGRSWGNPNNWDPNIVPDNNATNTFAVTIDAGGGHVRVDLRQSRTIDQLDCYGEVDLVMGPHDWQNEPVELILVDPSGLTNHGYLLIEGFEIEGNVTNTTGATLELEDMDIEGDLYNQAGAIMKVYHKVYVEGNLQNAGLLIVNPTGGLGVDPYLQNTGQINIWGGHCGSNAILDNNSTGVITGFGVLHAEQMLRNKGAIYAFGGSLAIGSGEGHLNLINEGTLRNWPDSSLCLGMLEDVNNHGTIEVNAGGGVAFDCNLVNEPNGVIKLFGGTLAAKTIVQKAGATFKGFGGITTDLSIDPNGIFIDPNATIELTGPTNIVGDVTIDPNATLEISDGTTLITGDCKCNYGTIHMKGGRIIIQGVFSNNNCRIIWEPGTYSNMADFNLDGTVNFKDFADFANTWLWQADWYTP